MIVVNLRVLRQAVGALTIVLAAAFGANVGHGEEGLFVGPAQTDNGLSAGTPTIDFTFDGATLPSTIAQFKERFPQATPRNDSPDEQVGLNSYLVEKLPSADRATFYFYNGALFQARFAYKITRLESQGGIATVVRKLVSQYGPADHVDDLRRTWTLNADQRADFYTRSEGCSLVITNTRVMGIVDRRETTQELTGAIDLGF